MNLSKKKQAIVLIIGIILIVLIVGGVSGGKPKSTPVKSATVTPSVTQTKTNSQKEQTPAPIVPSYTLVGSYGNGGKTYVIDPADATEEKLTLIGKDLNKKFGSDDFARLGIYTDRSQAKIMSDNPLDAANLEGAAADAYDKAYVAQFNVNKSTGLKKFFIFPMGENKEIKL